MAKAKVSTEMLNGFAAHFITGDAGDVLPFSSSVPVPRGLAMIKDVVAVGAKRIRQYPEGARAFPDPIAVGDNSDARPDLVPGVYVWEMLEDDTLSICLCGTRTDGRDFDSCWIDLKPGEEMQVHEGWVVAISGEFLQDGVKRGPLARWCSTKIVTLKAITRVIGSAMWAV